MTTKELLDVARRRLGIKELNPMQQRVWGCKASHMVLLSPTGSGKTLGVAGWLLPRLSRPCGSVQALVLAPSRELVIQIGEVLRSLADGYKVSTFYGKHSMTDEVNTLRIVPDIIVATPGRFLDHLNRRTVDPRGVSSLVIDEYDKCLELGFQGEMSRICRRLGRLRHIALTSATAIAEMPQFVNMSEAATLDYATGNESTRSRLHITRIPSPERDKLATLATIAERLAGDRAIVFVNHRESAERVFGGLKDAGIAASLYHGGLEQIDRERAVITLNNGSTPIMVATDLAARGLDIDAVKAVVHYHLPVDEAAWTHRNGRTARVDATGEVFVITGPGESLPEYIDCDNELPAEALPPRQPGKRLVTLYVNAGRKEKVSKGDILGFLVKTALVEALQIGRIDVRDHAAYVAVDAAALPSIHAVPTPRIKTRRVCISPLK